MPGQDVSVGGQGFTGYLASPAAGRGPAVLIIQEIFGVNAVMRALADEFAAGGFFVLVPDLFWRLEPGVQLSDKTEAEWQRAFGLMKRFDAAAGVKDIQTGLAYLRKLPGSTGKAGAVGFCLGGFLAYLTACRTDCDASVGYYGMNMQNFLGESSKIKKPLMLHVAGKDEYQPPEAQKQVSDGLASNPLVTIHTYPEMGHAFARPGGAHYDQANAGLANGRTITFFRQYLS
jgi:carboxymethylenebutenolidase